MRAGQPCSARCLQRGSCRPPCIGKRARQSRWPLSTDRVDALVQRFELLATLMLARQRQAPTEAADGAQHARFVAAVLGLPSGVLAIIGEAMMRLTSGSCACSGGSRCVLCSSVRRAREGRWLEARAEPALASSLAYDPAALHPTDGLRERRVVRAARVAFAAAHGVVGLRA